MTGALPAMVNALAPAALRGRYNAALTLAMTSGMWAGPLLAAAATALDQLSLLFAAAVALLGVMAVLVQRPGRLAATPATNCERHNGRARRAVGLCCPPKRGV